MINTVEFTSTQAGIHEKLTEESIVVSESPCRISHAELNCPEYFLDNQFDTDDAVHITHHVD